MPHHTRQMASIYCFSRMLFRANFFSLNIPAVVSPPPPPQQRILFINHAVHTHAEQFSSRCIWSSAAAALSRRLCCLVHEARQFARDICWTKLVLKYFCFEIVLLGWCFHVEKLQIFYLAHIYIYIYIYTTSGKWVSRFIFTFAPGDLATPLLGMSGAATRQSSHGKFG
jgi:hypothetical protein